MPEATLQLHVKLMHIFQVIATYFTFFLLSQKCFGFLLLTDTQVLTVADPPWVDMQVVDILEACLSPSRAVFFKQWILIHNGVHKQISRVGRELTELNQQLVHISPVL